MKPILDIQTSKLDEITEAEQKERMASYVNSLCRYDTNYKSRIGYMVGKSVGLNQVYINNFYWSVTYLYQYYEFSQRHFELLNIAAEHVEHLSQGEIDLLSADEEKEKARSELGDDLDKVTLIFQTAADKTEDRERAPFYAAMARKYSEKADAARGITTAPRHCEKILALYEQAARKYPDGCVIGELLRERAAEYRIKCEIKEVPEARTTSFSSSGEVSTLAEEEKTSEATPLLDSHRRSGNDLRRRGARGVVPIDDEERPPSSPSPS